MDIYIGNDIIDLQLMQNQNKRIEFIKRVFTPNEQEFIQTSTHPHKMMWAIWSAKEATFKAYVKYNSTILFAYQKFVVTDSTLITLQNVINNPVNHMSGMLKHQHIAFHLQWQFDAEKIHCLSVLQKTFESFQDWSDVKLSIQPNNYLTSQQNKHDMTLHFTQRELDNIFSIESLHTRFYAKQFLWTLGFDKNVEIIRQSLKNQRRLGPPMLYVKNELLLHQISLSHDGKWIAIAVT